MESGELEHADRILRDALDRAGRSGDRGLEANLRIVSLLLKEFTEPEHRSEEVLESVIPVLEELGDDLGLARAFRLLGDIHFYRSQYASADRALEQRSSVPGKRAPSTRRRRTSASTQVPVSTVRRRRTR